MDEFEYYEDVDNYLAIHDRLLQFHVIEEYIKNKEEINSCLTLREFKKQGINYIHYGQYSIFGKK